MAEIHLIPGIASPPAAPKPGAAEKTGDGTFLETLRNALTDVSDMQKSADSAILASENGKAGLQETLIAVQKADIAFRMVMQVRNKVLQAYQEVMRMNV